MTPTIFIILGITGDLAGRKLLPALLSLYVKKQLPSKAKILIEDQIEEDRGIRFTLIGQL